MNSEGLEERLKLLIGDASVRNFAHQTGLSIGAIRGILSGSKPTIDNLLTIAESCEVNPMWLATGEGAKHPGDALDTTDTDFLSAPRYDAAASCGAGAFVDEAPILDRIPFTKDFMQKKLGRTKTDGLILLDARGDSMEPTIPDGALMMIDTDPAALTSAIYAFSYDGALFVKRLNHLPDTVEAVSDNRDYSPFIISKEQMDNFRVIGRVVWVGHMI